MTNLLKGLKLREPSGSIVQAFEFDSATILNLQRWFDRDAIARLQNFVEQELGLINDKKDASSVSDNAAVLLRIEELATALSIVLSQPEGVEGDLALVGHKAFGNLQKTDILASELKTLASAIKDRLATYPIQGRRQSQTSLVSGIASEAKLVGMVISDSETSQFASVCQCIFAAARIPFDPRGSIRAYKKQA